MVLFDPRMKLKRYNTVMEIMEEFYQLRVQQYQVRKDYLISKLVRELQILSNKVKFITAIINDELVMKNVKKQVLCENLIKLGYTPMSKMNQIKSTKIQIFGSSDKGGEPTEGEEQGDGPEAPQTQEMEALEISTDPRSRIISPMEFNYLLQMPIWSLTYEKVQQLQNEHSTK